MIKERNTHNFPAQSITGALAAAEALEVAAKATPTQATNDNWEVMRGAVSFGARPV